MTVDPPTTGPSAADQVRAALRARGSRMTGPRASVVSVLERHGGHLTADEVHARLDDARVHLSTVYRTLDALTELGVVAHVHTSSGSARYTLAGHDPEHVHAQCSRCDRLIDLPSGVLNQVSADLRRNHGFVLDPGHVALSGICAECADA